MNEYTLTKFKEKIKKTINKKQNKINNEKVINPEKELQEYEFISNKYVYIRPLYNEVCSLYKNPLNILSSNLGNNIDQFFDLSSKQSHNTNNRLFDLHVEFSNTINDKILRKCGINISRFDELIRYFKDITSLRYLDKILSINKGILEDKFTFFITDIMFYAMADCVGIPVLDRSIKYLTGMKKDYNDYIFCKCYCKLFDLDFNIKENFKHLIHESSWFEFCENFEFNKDFNSVMTDWDTVLKRGFLYTISLLSKKEKDEIIYCYVTSLTEEQREKFKKEKNKPKSDKEKLFNLANILFQSTDQFHTELFKHYSDIIMENFTLDQAKRMLDQVLETKILGI